MNTQQPPPYTDEGFCNMGCGSPGKSDMDKQQPPSYNDEGLRNMGYGSPGLFPSAPAVASPYMAAPTVQPQPSTVIINQPQAQPVSNNVVVVGTGSSGLPGCPVCHNGSWTGTYSCCAWLWCLCCCPCGLICCLCMRKKKCTKCGYTVG